MVTDKNGKKPGIITGQDNWYLIITRSVREGGTNKPIASKTLLVWVIHGHKIVFF